MAEDHIQHGIDDDPRNDAEKGAALGGLGGAAVGAIAGAAAGPLGAVIGAVAGGLVGAGASGAAVSAVDQIDNDNTVTGLGDDGVATRTDDDLDDTVISDMDTTGNRTGFDSSLTGVDTSANRLDSSTVTAIPGTGSIGGTTTDYDRAIDDRATTDYNTATNLRTSNTPTLAHSGSDYELTGATSDYEHDYGTGSQGELAHDQRNATTGITSIGGTDMNADAHGDNIGNGIPGVQTGGTTTDGTPDTRGITEKAADTLTGRIKVYHDKPEQ